MSAASIPLMMLALRNPVAGIIATLLALVLIYFIRKRLNRQFQSSEPKEAEG